VNILLVEDDPFKEDLLTGALHLMVATAHFAVARSVQQAVDKLADAEYDLIILDMSLPSHEIRAGGAQPMSQPSGGIEVLLELSYEGRGDRVLIVTQYPEIEFNDVFYALAKFPKAVTKELNVNLQGVVYFSEADGDWRRHLKAAIA
jgi:CheY-like chemotaxis protein